MFSVRGLDALPLTHKIADAVCIWLVDLAGVDLYGAANGRGVAAAHEQQGVARGINCDIC
jgi:hypothetical protein